MIITSFKGSMKIFQRMMKLHYPLYKSGSLRQREKKIICNCILVIKMPDITQPILLRN
ncbi:hypothetical protein ACFP3I_11615 [Chryseobacterium arachidis]|uniref:hypothetical protein n=1 Tax=Chryseobacterium arachidis TaxID=1416778 RepID=UPI003619C64A